jgi:outer membrane protein, heavy metal efflux system
VFRAGGQWVSRKNRLGWFGALVACSTMVGCATTPPPERPFHFPSVSEATTSPVQQVSSAAADKPLTLANMQSLTLERHPRLAQVGWQVEAARGQATQAGLYPNPTLNIGGDELGDVQGTGGIWTAPVVHQEIVTGGKLKWSAAAAWKGVDQATLDVIAERFRLLAAVRGNFLEVLVLQQRVAILDELVSLAEQTVDNARKLLNAKLGSELDVVQLEVDLERYKAEADATRKTLPAAFRKLAASVGAEDLPTGTLLGDLDQPLPVYDLDAVKSQVVGWHPLVQSAQLGVEKAQLQLKRATLEPIPNVTVGTGYTRQNQNKSDDWMFSLSVPLPTWNRNQGNIRTAQAEVGVAINAIGRVQNDLTGQVATAYAAYTSARQRAEKYRTAVVPKALQSYQLALKGQKGGEFEYLRVLQAQRAVAEARLEALRATGEAWRAAAELSGLTLEDEWPTKVK